MHSYCKLHDTLDQQCRINPLPPLPPLLFSTALPLLSFLSCPSFINLRLNFILLDLHPCHVLTKEDGNFHTNYDSSNIPCTFTIHFSLQSSNLSSQGFLLLTPLLCSLRSHDLNEGAAEIPPDPCNFNHLHRSKTT